MPLGLGQSMARFRVGAGCALGQAVDMAKSVAVQPNAGHAAANTNSAQPNAGNAEQPWPSGSKVDTTQLTQAVRTKLDRALQNGFAEADANQERRTRAIVVVHRGRIVAERYADGFGAHTRMAGWSMAKSVTSAWIGALTQERVFAIDEPIALSAWRDANDSRQRLSFRHLLQMASGLEFSEIYSSPFSDVNRMLFFSPSTSAYVAAKLPVAEPGAVFNYSSGTTNLLSLAVRERLAGDYESSPYRLIFNRIGMDTAIVEADASGTYVGSSYLYASARDWARFGLLYLRDGVWNDQRVLPPRWVAFSVQPSAANRNYGAHCWLHEPAEKAARTVPLDLYQATGHAGQRVSIIPSHDLVVVRLGMTLKGEALRHAELIGDIIKAIN